MPAYTCSGWVLGYEECGKRVGLGAGELCGAETDGVEFIGNFRSGTYLTRRKRITLAKLHYTAFGDDAMHADLPEGEGADDCEKVLLFSDG